MRTFVRIDVSEERKRMALLFLSTCERFDGALTLRDGACACLIQDPDGHMLLLEQHR